MNRNELCECGSGKKYKKCCGNKYSPKKKKTKFIIILFSIFLLAGAGFGFKKIMDQNRVNANPNATYCADCGRYH